MSIKTKSLFLVAILALSGCATNSPAPVSEKPILQGSGEELEKSTNKGFAKLFYKDKVSTVDVPAATVRKRLAAFAKQCLDQRTIVTERTGYGMYGGGYQRIDWHFKAHMTRENGVDRLLILVDSDDNGMFAVNKDGFRAAATTQVLPEGNKTILKSRQMVFWDSLHDGAVEWASGETSVCPRLGA